jgi:hypothetical protein
VAADGLVELVEERAGREQMLGGAKVLLHRPQLLVAEHGFERVEIGVGAQHEDAVEPFLDREVILAEPFSMIPNPSFCKS